MTKEELEKIRDEEANTRASMIYPEYWRTNITTGIDQELNYSIRVHYKECFKSGFNCASQLLMKEIESLQAKLKVAEDALEFYGNEYNYAVEIDPLLGTKIKTKIRDDNEHWGYQASPEDKNILVVCAGKRAREALAELRENE